MYVKMFKRGLQTRLAIMFACQLAFVLFGYDQGVFSGIVGNQHFLETMGRQCSTSERLSSADIWPRSQRQLDGHHCLDLQPGLFYGVHCELLHGKLARSTPSHVVRDGLDHSMLSPPFRCLLLE